MPEHARLPSEFPEQYYLQASAAGAKILIIDYKQSLIEIKVSRAGPLARLGHDHIVASHDVSGYVDTTAARADLYVPLDRLVVDKPILRAEAGLTTQPSAEAIEGTRRNMLDKVLEVDRFPFALIAVKQSLTDSSKLNITITLHNTKQMFEIPAQIENREGGLKISGEMDFDQSDFGITPFSILGGAIQVQDRLQLRFRIVAGEKY